MVKYSLTMLLILGAGLLIGSPDLTSDLAPNVKAPFQQYIPTPNHGTDSILWVTKAPSPSPGRYWCPAVGVCRDTIYLFAGRGDGGYANSIRSVYGYVPATNIWVTNLPSLLITRRAGGGGQVGNKVYVCGGRDSTHTTLATCEEYDLDTKTSTYKANMPSARWSCSGAAIGDKVYVFGSEAYSDALLEYNTTSNTWRSISPTPRPPGRGWNAVAAAGGKLYAVGGTGSAGALGDCWEFDPVGETWTQKANMPGTRTYHAAVGFGDDNVYVIGGNAAGGTSPGDNIVYKYTVSTNTWETEYPIPTPRGWEMLAVNEGSIYVMCGSDCATPTYLTVNEAGEIEAPREHDAGVTNIISPVGRIPSGTPINVEATIKNFGSNDETFPVTATIMEGASTVFEMETTLTITARQEQTVIFGQFTPNPDLIYDDLFYTNLVGDENPANDTMRAEARTTPDAGVLRITSPITRLTPNITVNASAVVMNFSAEPKNVPTELTVVDTVTHATVLDVDTTLAMGAAESLAVVFGQFTSVSGSVYDVIAWTSLAGDDDPSNDTANAMAACGLGSAPDSFGYYYESTQEPSDTVTFSWIDPTGGTQLTGWVGTADDGYVIRTLPFSIKYYSETPNVSSINVCTNGFLSTSTMTSYNNTALPASTITNLIAPFWDDLNLSTQGAVYENIGYTDGGYVAYSWVGVPQFTGGALETFQVVLYRNNKIRFNYFDMNGTLNANTIGIQGATGAGGLYQQYAFDGVPANHIIASNNTIQFTCDRLVGISENTPATAPITTQLNTAKPNPVLNGIAQISFTLAKKGNVAINIYDATGRNIRNLVNAPYEAGEYTVTWDGKNDRGNQAMAGVYFYTIQTNNYHSTRKLVLMR
jgi:N-acetylneuraminic acid mutarotase